MNIKNIEHTIKHSLISFFKIILILILRNRKDKIYIAVCIDGGLGDNIRQKTVLTELVKMEKSIVFDMYCWKKKSYKVFRDIKNIRFYVLPKTLQFTNKRYDIIYKLSMYESEIKYIKNSDLTARILKNLKEYKNQYQNGCPHIVNTIKMTAGVDNISYIDFKIPYKERNLGKLGIFKDTKYITFQYGFGSQGQNYSAKCWDFDKWEELLSILKNILDKDIKIVQVGLSRQTFKDADINTARRTNFDELCSILRGSLLHIDIDGACSHIAKALNTKSLIMFGPTDSQYGGYKENINITSLSCKGCWKGVKYNHDSCQKGYAKPKCMDEISPQLVADKALEYISIC
ncbi:MAG: hypothetical protein LBV16_02955 [Elusimicrobiota bacterium]|jgi:ADP-heptose:LPS heptosyltransferase|nr:hypothetical protein [Elusimicrobiota bacterium]